ncbi:aminoglycoside 2'-N-acetyltransferase [Streptomyces cinereospinus]|uniref:Aminoglycoside 2'-N-acetyltransferase n=1 Tax=Streptomyces cinereospinus TaxID=285561 RepID=A0ABV5MY72_9ACTN
MTAHTADLAPAELAAARALVRDAFDGDLTDEDWGHTLGGMHALVHDERGLVAHGAVVMRRARYGGRRLRVGCAEGVAVRADARRRGHGGTVTAALEGVVARAYDLVALSAGDDGARLCAARGRRVCGGRLCALGPDGVVRLPDEEGSTCVWPVPADGDDPDAELLFDWRDGDVL